MMLSLRCLSDSQVEILLGNFKCKSIILSSQIWKCRFEDLEEETKTIGTEITQTLLYSEYDVSENKWNTIVEDVESGSAKIKYDSDKNIKVIYQKGNGKDYTITLNKIETEE